MLRRRSPGHLYMAHLREFLTSHRMVFKVGRSADNNICNRTRSYPKGSAIHMIVSVGDVLEAEATMLRILRQLPALIARTDLGSEYFEGDPQIIATVVASMHTAFRPQFTPDEVIEAPTEADEPRDASDPSDVADQDVQMVDAVVEAADTEAAVAEAEVVEVVVVPQPVQPPNKDADALLVSYIEANRSTLSGATVRATDLLKSIVAFGVERNFTGRLDLARVQRQARMLFAAKLAPTPFQDGIAPAVVFPTSLSPAPEALVEEEVRNDACDETSFLARFLVATLEEYEPSALRRVAVVRQEDGMLRFAVFKEAFSQYMRDNYPGEKAKLMSDHSAILDAGYNVVTQMQVCKSCNNKAEVGCCSSYSIANRTRCDVITGLALQYTPP